LVRDFFLPSIGYLIVLRLVALHASPFNFRQGVTLGDGGMAFDTLHPFRHHIGQTFFLSEGFSLNELDLSFMTFRTIRCRLMMTPQALHSGLANLSMFLS